MGVSSGNDVRVGRGHDIVFGREGDDTLMIVNTGLSFQHLEFSISGGGKNLVIETYYDTRIVLQGAGDLTLTADDFVFNDIGYLG